MRITAVTVKNFKRIHEIAIRPDADRTLVLIGGRNANGKSSLLDALTVAFGGKRQQPADPVRHGADLATIRVELDGGELEVTRVIRPDGESALEVRDRLGAVKAPQAMLDQLIGARFLDPLAFLQLPAKEQRAQLMRIIPGADRIADLDASRERAFASRTEVGRDLVKAKARLQSLPDVSVGEPIDIAALHEEARAFAEQQRAGEALGAQHRSAQHQVATVRSAKDAGERRCTDLERQIEALQAKLTEERRALAGRLDELNAAETAEHDAKAKLDEAGRAWSATSARRAQLDADIKRADAHNREVYAAETKRTQRAEASAEVEKLGAKHAKIAQLIVTIDDRKAQVLAEAKLPVDGLAVTDDGITLGGVPFAQASYAERFSVALALAIAASPGLDDVWIRDGAMLDEESLARIHEHAVAAGKRPWIELVGTREPGVIEIRDGRVVPVESNNHKEGTMAPPAKQVGADPVVG